MDSLFVLQILKPIVEIALMFFLARGLMVLFFLPARHKLEGNFIYQLFVKGTQPLVAAMRYLTPVTSFMRFKRGCSSASG